MNTPILIAIAFSILLLLDIILRILSYRKSNKKQKFEPSAKTNRPNKSNPPPQQTEKPALSTASSRMIEDRTQQLTVDDLYDVSSLKTPILSESPPTNNVPVEFPEDKTARPDGPSYEILRQLSLQVHNDHDQPTLERSSQELLAGDVTIQTDNTAQLIRDKRAYLSRNSNENLTEIETRETPYPRQPSIRVYDLSPEKPDSNATSHSSENKLS